MIDMVQLSILNYMMQLSIYQQYRVGIVGQWLLLFCNDPQDPQRMRARLRLLGLDAHKSHSSSQVRSQIEVVPAETDLIWAKHSD